MTTVTEAVEFEYDGETRKAIFYGEEFEGIEGKLTLSIDVDKQAYRTFKVDKIKNGKLVTVPISYRVRELLADAKLV